MFGYIYPADRAIVPDRVLDDLLARVRAEPPAADVRHWTQAIATGK